MLHRKTISKGLERSVRWMAMILLPLALAACSNPDRFGDGTNSVDLQPTIGAQGDPSDPTSIAYFNASVGDRVFFVVDQSSLTPQAEAVLVSQANWLAANPAYDALIEGHADEQGTREYNLALGARRAAAVQEFLVSQGVSPSRLTTVTYGKERPVEVCSEERCYERNRRAVTVLRAAAGLGS